MLMRGFPEYLRDRGWEVHVVSAPGPSLDSLRKVVGNFTHAIEMTRDPSPLSDLKSLMAWIVLLRKIRPTVTSIGTPKAGLVGGLAAFLTRVPRRVYLLRGLRLETTHGFRRRIFTLIEKLSIFVAHDVLSVSPSLRQRTIDLRLVKPEKIVVLGAGSSNGVDTEEYSPANVSTQVIAKLGANLGLAKDVPVIGFVGRLTIDKGLIVLSEAREILTEASIDHQLLLVGGIDDGQSESILTKVKLAGRPATITGHVADPRPYYHLMDLLCLPTFREGFPNVVLEAAASGIPTVTTNATGAVDSVINGQSGIVVAVGSSSALANGIAEILSDSNLRERMGTAAREHVVTKYDRSDVWHRIETFYRAADTPSQLNRHEVEG